MATLKDRVVQQGTAIILSDAYNNFGYLAAALAKAPGGVTLTLDQSYVSTYDVVDELRKRVKDKTSKPPADVRPLLDANKTIVDIVNEKNFDKLKTYIDGLAPSDYEPPLPADFISAGRTSVKRFPNKPSLDPRRTGRLVIPKPAEALKQPEVQKWICNNAVLYGYVPYDDKALYYVGVQELKNIAKSGGNVGITAAINKFLNNSSGLGQLAITAQQVLDNKLPDIGNFPDPGNLETLPNHNVQSNDKRILDLVVVTDQPVWRPVALAFLAMQADAKKAGIDLRINSGFRPAFGANITVTSSKGRQIRLTTQETLRRDRSRWVGRGSYPGSDEDFIFKAGSSKYNAQTAPPGGSKHGSGTAIDLNVGGRTNFSPLKTANYVWLIKNSWKYGLIRTVPTEEWHFEYEPALAKNGPYGAIAGTHQNRFYNDLGLASGQFQFA